MSDMTPFGPASPWYDSYVRFGPPNLKWCEERLNGWAGEPANTWSNGGYLIAGVWIALQARRKGSVVGQVFGAIVFVMGACSLLYHASNNFLTQAFDFLGMFLMAFFVIAVNARRLGWPRQGLELVYGAAVIGWTLALWPIEKAGLPIQWLMAMAAVLIAGTELAARRRSGDAKPMGFFWVSAAFLVLGELCSLADLKRIWCDPTNHWLQGHAAWHVLGAAGMAALYLYYAEYFDRAWSKAPVA